jgi:hypothetical protein
MSAFQKRNGETDDNDAVTLSQEKRKHGIYVAASLKIRPLVKEPDRGGVQPGT